MAVTPTSAADQLRAIDALIADADGLGQITSADAPYSASALAAISAARQARTLAAELIVAAAAASAWDEPVPVLGADGVYIRATRCRVAALPPHHVAERYVGLDLVQVGRNEWEIRHGDERLRPADGRSWYEVPDRSEDEWRASFRAPFEHALAAAAALAPRIINTGMQAADFLRVDQEAGR